MNILAIGWFGQMTGYGIHTDGFFNALSKYCQVSRIVLYPDKTGKVYGPTTDIDATICLAPPVQFPELMNYAKGLKIAYWAMEDTFLPHKEVACVDFADKRWVTSHWGKKMLEQQNIISDVVPEGIDPELFENISPIILDNRFKFLCVAQSVSKSRKNIDLLLKAFSEEFKDNEACLYWPSYYKPDSLPSNVYWIKPNPDNKQFVRLYASCDAFVLPTRSEGWGLPILEALAAGIPVITTKYSGQSEFVTEENSHCVKYQIKPYIKTDSWCAGAEADLHDLKRLMRHVYENSLETKKTAKANSQKIKEMWSWDQAAKKAITLMQSYFAKI